MVGAGRAASCVRCRLNPTANGPAGGSPPSLPMVNILYVEAIESFASRTPPRSPVREWPTFDPARKDAAAPPDDQVVVRQQNIDRA